MHSHGKPSEKELAIQRANVLMERAIGKAQLEDQAWEHEAAAICSLASPNGLQWRWANAGGIEFYYA